MLRVIDVWKTGPATGAGTPLLAGATVDIPSGRKIALLGPSAEANLAVLRLFSGLDQPEKGVLRRTGLPCWPFDYSDYLDSKLTVAQNVGFLSRVYGVNGEDVLRIAATLSNVRIARGKPVGHYSVTERRSLQLGVTLAFQFDWYFVNEKLPPSPEDGAAMDAALADRFDRATVIWATAVPERLKSYCDAGLVLDRGQLAFYSRFEDAVEVYKGLNPGGIGKRDGRKARDERERREHPAGSPGPVDS